jgi:hypothetical protein
MPEYDEETMRFCVTRIEESQDAIVAAKHVYQNAAKTGYYSRDVWVARMEFDRLVCEYTEMVAGFEADGLIPPVLI